MAEKLNTTNQMVRAFARVLEMKPETMERRAVKRRRDIAERRALHIERLKAVIAKGDTTGMYAEMLAEAEARQAETLAKLD